MSGNLLGLIELALVFLVVLGWAFYELYALKAEPPADSHDGTGRADDAAGTAPDRSAGSATAPRHPERQ